MVDQTKQPQALFPDYPRDLQTVDKEGELTEQWQLGMSSLFQALQKNFKNEGILFPSLTQTQISSIQAIYTPYIGQPLPQDVISNKSQLNIPDISGQTVFDSTNRIPKQFIITYDNATPRNVVSAQWYIMNVMLITDHNPNNPPVVSGTLYSFCYDTVAQVLYICTATPSTWTVV